MGFLYMFAQESNKIEGINGDESAMTHFKALEKFLSSSEIIVEDLKRFVGAIEPKATYRPESKTEVMIGGRYGMGSSRVHEAMLVVLDKANKNILFPNVAHIAYEDIHPFSDGNGRSGRALWLWQMNKFFRYDGNLGFLHKYYYEGFRE